MFNEKKTNINKESIISNIFKNYKHSEKFTFQDYSRLKKLTQLSKLEELKVIDKITDYKANIIDDNKNGDYKFLRQETKCITSDYIPKTNYGYKNRSKKYSTLFKKQINLNFTEKKNKKIKIENNFPTDFDEINEQIELNEIENISSMNRYFNKENKNIIQNIEEISNTSNNKTKRAQSLTTRNIKNLYSKSFTETSLNHLKTGSKRKSDIQRPVQSSRLPKNKINLNKNIINLKLGIKNINSRNSTNFNLSNFTTSFNSFSKNQSRKSKYINTFKKIEKNILNPDSFFITKNNNNPGNYTTRPKTSKFKTSNQLINRIINDGNIIDKYITSHRLIFSKNKNTDKESILLKLKERLDSQKNPKTKSSDKKTDLTDEEIFSKKLSLVPGFAKQFFRDIYNKILFENRILNKNEDYNIKSEIEKINQRKRLNNQIKKDTNKIMRITKGNIITEKDDQKVIEEQKKQFDFYGNLDGLEWLLMKKNIIKYGKKYH